MIVRKLRSYRPRITVSITHDVLALLEEQALSATNQETGGIVAGSGSVEEGNVVISHASDGGPRASSTPTSFSRDTSYCQGVVDKWASQSSGKIDYLGEWHKHFESDPKPSLTDLATLGSIARDPGYHTSRPLLLIIGDNNARSSLRVYVVDDDERSGPMGWRLSTESQA